MAEPTAGYRYLKGKVFLWVTRVDKDLTTAEAEYRSTHPFVRALHMKGQGKARRSQEDHDSPRIGSLLARGRALRALGGKMIDLAWAEVRKKDKQRELDATALVNKQAAEYERFAADAAKAELVGTGQVNVERKVLGNPAGDVVVNVDVKGHMTHRQVEWINGEVLALLDRIKTEFGHKVKADG